MTEELGEALKKEMGYTDLPRPKCVGCAHGTLEESLYVDRDFYVKCSFNTIGSLVVSEHGWCKHHQPRPDTKAIR